jgi:flagellar hook-associated protein 1 FlgK
MTGLFGLLNVASDGLTAQSFGLNVTGQNVSNANTPQYMRRIALLATQNGPGVQIQGQRQVSDAYAENSVYSATGLKSSASELDSNLASLENVFNDNSGTGLASSLNGLFQVFQQLSTNPSDPTVRQSVLNAADQFAKRSNEIAGSIASQRTDLFSKAEKQAEEANQESSQVAKLNQQIAEALMNGRDASGLIDQRNKVLLGLSEIINIQVISGDHGTVTVQAGGTTLVESSTTRSLSVGLDSEGQMAFLAQRTGSSDTPSDITATVTGGSLSAVKQARDEDLAAVSKKFDSYVYDVASAINTQHAAGVAQDGQSGYMLFDIPATSDSAGQLIALSADVAGKPANVAAGSSSDGSVGDSSNAVLLGGLASGKIVNGTSTPSAAYGDIVGDVGTRRAGSKSDLQLRQAILDQSNTARESVSGVSLDEEMVNLQKYQQGYQANSKMLTVVNGLLQDLLNVVR